ncbi:MAG: PAS domain S-box protein [Gammaproteobacteria bacterium]|nr:PAS domain S-box protein [Gammaproteobacteria bacterium]
MLYIVLFSSIVTLILTAIQLRIDYNEGINVIHQRIKQIELTNLDSIRQSLWTIDTSSIQIQADGLSRINDIIFVEITDENNRLVASAGKVDTKNTIRKNIELVQEYRGKKTALGTLTIVATKENVYQKLIDTVVVILISQAIKTFLVSLFVLIIFYYLVTRHLEKISQHFEKLELTSRPVSLSLNRHNSDNVDDELSRVVKSINKMSNHIYQSYTEILGNQHDLAEREAKFSAIFNSITDAIVIVDNDRKIIQTNPAFHTTFGYSKEDIKDKTTLMLYDNSDEYFNQGEKRYNPQAKTTPGTYEINYKRKDGSLLPSETLGGPINLPDGTQLGYIGIIRDISARKTAEKEKARLQKQLQQSQKMHAIGQLTGGIAHDFNNILASILGYSELAQQITKNSGDSKLVQYIERINIAGERARKLVAQLLAFSRGAPADLQSIKLPVLIDDVISLIRPTIPSSILLRTEIDDQIPAVLMDNTQMHQMLMNLCINARDAMTGNGIMTIKLSHETSVDKICNSCNGQIQGEYVQLTVEDTGSGILPEILDSIFDPFLTTKDVGKGTGMGLSVVHGILHKHHSHIVVETKPGSGTHFHLLIPPFYEDKASPITEQPVVNFSHDIGNGKHLLIVDDEETLATFLQDFLQTYGYRVTISTSSKHAIELIRHPSADFDLIITDQTMPEMTGTEMIKEILQINSDLPVILCSGYSELIDKDKALKLGCSKYLDKPIQNRVLIQSVYDILTTKN